MAVAVAVAVGALYGLWFMVYGLWLGGLGQVFCMTHDEGWCGRGGAACRHALLGVVR